MLESLETYLLEGLLALLAAVMGSLIVMTYRGMRRLDVRIENQGKELREVITDNTKELRAEITDNTKELRAEITDNTKELRADLRTQSSRIDVLAERLDRNTEAIHQNTNTLREYIERRIERVDTRERVSLIEGHLLNLAPAHRERTSDTQQEPVGSSAP